MAAGSEAAQRQLVIARLRQDDETAIAQAASLLMSAFPHWTPDRASAGAVVNDCLTSDRICLAARNGAALLGWIGAIPAYSHAWELHPLVAPGDAHGLGIGRALIAALEDRVRQLGALTLYLGTDDDGPAPGTSAGGVNLFPGVLAHAFSLTVIDHAAGFYRRLGFEVVGLIPDANGPGKPDVLMAKQVPTRRRVPLTGTLGPPPSPPIGLASPHCACSTGTPRAF